MGKVRGGRSNKIQRRAKMGGTKENKWRECGEGGGRMLGGRKENVGRKEGVSREKVGREEIGVREK